MDNSQAVIISDAETELKLLLKDCVLKKLNYSETNKRVNEFIVALEKRIDNKNIQSIIKNTFPQLATRVYIKLVEAYGVGSLALMVMAVAKAKGNIITDEVKRSFKNKMKPLNYNHASANDIYDKEYQKKLVEKMNEIADMHAKEDYSSNFSVRAQAERELRWEWHENQLKEFRNGGVNLVWIDSHANCSERCQPYQGKLYSLDHTSGIIDGISYEPLEVATDIYDITKSGKTYKNGCISGFNCRHKLIPYKKGFKPQTIPISITKKRSEVEKQQRYMERTIRRYEDYALMNRENPKAYNHYKELSKEWLNRYQDYSKSNDIPFYRSRIK